MRKSRVRATAVVVSGVSNRNEIERATMMKKKSGKSKASMDKDTNLLDQQHMGLQKSNPNSLKEEAAAGRFEEQYFAIWAYKFREQELVDAWPELESAAEKHGLYLTLHREKLYIAISTTPRTRDPHIFNMAKEFIQILAKTIVPPSVAIKILNGDLRHDYVLVGHQRGGLCLEHEIKKEQFYKRWGRFIDILQDLGGILGLGLYYTGNTIVTVGRSLPVVKLIRGYVEACIVYNMKPASLLKKVKAVSDRGLVQRKLEALSI